MTKKIFRQTLFVVTTVLIMSVMTVSVILFRQFSVVIDEKMENEMKSISAGIGVKGYEYLDDTEFSHRITIITPEGDVFFDSDDDIVIFDDHSGRIEVISAITDGYGKSSRHSDTLGIKMIYIASRLDDGNILRLSTPASDITNMITSALYPIISMAALGIVVSAILAGITAGNIVKPINDIDLEKPAENMIYEELSPILRKMNQQNIMITEQIEQLREKADELDQITYSMSEGLILLDKDKKVKRMNPAARNMYGEDKTLIGYEFSSIDRSHFMAKAVEDALVGKHSEFREMRDGREYSFSISPIAYRGGITGCIILCFDVSDMANAEIARREFTANVSHELKTPMQSIIGSAELLLSGLVRQEDEEKFLSNIKNEASRLVSLINDIIRLSQMDENTSMPSEEADLYEIAKEVINDLRGTAEKKDITLILEGEKTVMKGIRRYLYEIIYNLCDNSIRYNTPGGNVTVKTYYRSGQTILSVSDTGIGIPHSHVPRIFERFYRVDKSHSKETGGTGLGLSIVKHAVMYHKGTIKTDSTPGKGTTITITF